MRYDIVRRRLNDKNLLIVNQDCKYGHDKLRPHSRGVHETMTHFMAKAMLFKLIYDKSDGVLTEHECPNGRVIDVLQLKQKSIIGYEVENSDYDKCDVNGVDLIVIDLRKFPQEFADAVEVIKKNLEAWVI
jgi:hypothetical protein